MPAPLSQNAVIQVAAAIAVAGVVGIAGARMNAAAQPACPSPNPYFKFSDAPCVSPSPAPGATAKPVVFAQPTFPAIILRRPAKQTHAASYSM